MGHAIHETIGPYRITDRLGVGGMGAVYRGVRPDQDAAVAIKTVTVAREALLPAIRREIHALRKLRHPGIVRILDSGTDHGIPWYAMELLDPRSLATYRDELWASGRPAPDRLREILTILRRLAAPLAYLHGEGMVHGDLKPSNVLLTPDGRPLLIDFGLLTTFGEHPSRDAIEPGVRGVGSAAYMAPEQIDGGEPVDARADLYALGCILYELLTGRPPFDHARLEDVLRAHRETPPAPPSAQGLPRALDDLILRLLAKKPRDRIGHAEDVASRLVALGAEPGDAIGPRPRTVLYRPSLAGRRPTFEALEAEITSRFGASRGGMSFVVGESGVGKTRLCVEISRQAQALGARVLSGGCAPLGSALHALTRPLQAVADRCRAEGPAETRRLLGSRGKLLARYQPALASLADLHGAPEPVDLPAEAAHELVSHELCATFEALAQDRPLLLVLDDLQWADELTLAFLTKLLALATLSRARLFVLGTARSDGIGDALGKLVQEPHARRIDLDRLDEDGVRAMVADMLALPSPGNAFVRFITKQTEGNPFFVAEYLRASVNEGLLMRDDRGRWELVGDDEASLASLPLPRSLRDLVAQRLDGLDEGARRVADLAAVIGREIDPALLDRVAAIDEAAFAQATSELVARQVFEDTKEGLRFSHDKLREVAYDRLGDDVKASLHRVVAEALDTRPLGSLASPGVAEAAAHHWIEAGDGAKAAPLLLAAAGESLAAYDNERAVATYERALAVLEAPSAAVQRNLFTRRALWEEAADPGAATIDDEGAALGEARRKAHRGLGDALTVLGRYDDALDAYAAALQHSSTEEARADVLGRTATARFSKGELRIAAGHLTDALGHLGDRVPEDRPRLLASIGASAARLGARLAWRRPITADHLRAIESLRVRLLNRLTYIHYSFSMERAVATHLAALAAAERIAATRDGAETFAHHGVLFAGIVPVSSRFYARRAVAVCRREGHLAMQMTAELMAGLTFTFQGRFGEATAHYRAAIALYPKVGDVNVLQTARENLAYALLYRGDHADALAEASLSLGLAERAGDIRGTCNSGCHVALAAARLGDLSRARRVAGDTMTALASLDDHVVHAIAHTVVGRIALASGERDEARAALERAVAIADEHKLVQEEVAAAYIELAELFADVPAPPVETARLLDKARALARRFPAHRGPTLRAEARILARRGDRRAALHALSRALDALHERGMRHEEARTWEVMASLAKGAEQTRARERALALYRETRAAGDAHRMEASVLNATSDLRGSREP